MSWLFEEIPEASYAAFRLALYGLFLYFFTEVFHLGYSQWARPEMAGFYRPVSFFGALSFEQVSQLASRDLLGLWQASLLAAALGLFYPVSSVLSFVLLLLMAGIPLNFGKIHHIHHMPVVVLGIMALSWTPGNWSLDRLLWGPRARPTFWPLRTAQLYMCLVYFASGFQKMATAGLDWIFSQNMQHIILTRPTITPFGLQVAQFPRLCQAIALVTVLAQLGAPLALWSRPLRLVLVPTLFMLHIGTYLTLGNHGYFFPYNLCFLVWVPWHKASWLLYAGARLSEKLRWPGKLVRRFHVHALFPALSWLLRRRHGPGVEFRLRHSVLSDHWNPFLSDVDYSVIIHPGAEGRLDAVVRDTVRLSRLKVFDLPQFYLLEEWRAMEGFDGLTQARLKFFWNCRKWAWIKRREATGAYETFKKERALRLTEAALSGGSEFFPPPTSQDVCLYSNFLEVNGADRVIVCDRAGLDFIVSLLPCDPILSPLPADYLALKKALWTHEYLLSRSHLRLHSRKGADCGKWREWLRELEIGYQVTFQGPLIAAGPESDWEG